MTKQAITNTKINVAGFANADIKKSTSIKSKNGSKVIIPTINRLCGI